MYLTENFLLRIFLKTIDLLLNTKNRKTSKNIIKINKILISNIGHLGDVVISTAVIKLIKSNYPDVKIGFLTSTWSLPIIKESSQVDFSHTFDHFMLNRGKSIFERLKFHSKSASKSKKEILLINYDAAIDLRHFFPNSIFLLYKSKIPIITGFNSGGFGPLLNFSHNWENKNQHLSKYHLELVHDIFSQINDTNNLKTNLNLHFDINEENILLRQNKLKRNNYVIFHPGTGNPVRKWPNNYWVQLANLLLEQGEYIVFTGKSYNENQDIISITKNITTSKYINLCDQLSYIDYCTIVKNSKYLVSVESFAGHLSGALNKAAVIIGSGTTNKHQWRPLGDSVKYITKDIWCSPCYMGSGCETMDCINLITPSIVYNEIIKFV